MPTDTMSDRIDLLFEQEKWATARKLIERELAKLPDGDWMRHWWLTRLSTTYYEERDYEKAFGFVYRAHTIAPDCPLVLWDYAGTLDMMGQTAEAVRAYRKLITRGAKAIASDQCGEGEEWAAGLLTDCYYRLAFCYQTLGKDDLALETAERTLRRVQRGSVGIYDKAEMDALVARC